MKKYTHSEGYIVVYQPDHPACHKGCVYEHRLVMEKKLGRFLTGDEVVHHKNGNRADNSVANLELCENRKEHMRMHQDTTRREDGKWLKKCAGCGRWLEISAKNYAIRKSGKGKGSPYYLCKICANKKRREYYQRNTERLKAKQKVYYWSNVEVHRKNARERQQKKREV